MKTKPKTENTKKCQTITVERKKQLTFYIKLTYQNLAFFLAVSFPNAAKSHMMSFLDQDVIEMLQFVGKNTEN